MVNFTLLWCIWKGNKLIYKNSFTGLLLSSKPKLNQLQQMFKCFEFNHFKFSFCLIWGNLQTFCNFKYFLQNDESANSVRIYKDYLNLCHIWLHYCLDISIHISYSVRSSNLLLSLSFVIIINFFLYEAISRVKFDKYIFFIFFQPMLVFCQISTLLWN